MTEVLQQRNLINGEGYLGLKQPLDSSKKTIDTFRYAGRCQIEKRKDEKIARYIAQVSRILMLCQPRFHYNQQAVKTTYW